MRPQRGRPTLKEIRQVARATVAILTNSGLECCLFGSAACSMYGASRLPNDVDVIVLNLWDSWNVEDVKELLEREDDNFFRVDSTNPRNTYKVLWYSLPSQTVQRACKVDILVPGTVGIPQIPISQITYTDVSNRIPVVTFLVLILLKLKGWIDHHHHFRADMIEKQHVDVRDINELLSMINEDDHLSKESWLPKRFVKLSRKRVGEYVRAFPDSADSWRSVGFHV